MKNAIKAFFNLVPRDRIEFEMLLCDTYGKGGVQELQSALFNLLHAQQPMGTGMMPLGIVIAVHFLFCLILDKCDPGIPL